MSLSAPAPRRDLPSVLLLAGLVVALVLWWLVYGQLQGAARWLVAVLPVANGSHMQEALQFFFYDVPKVLMLLVLVVFAMGVVRSFFSPVKTRSLLSGRREGLGNILAAGLGVFTPFCSCSAVPLFVGFVSAGVPLGVTFSFLIAAPMVNEVALGLLLVLVGWRGALTYLAFGLALAIVAGWIIGRLHLEHWLEDWVRQVRAAPADLAPEEMTLHQRLQAGGTGEESTLRVPLLGTLPGQPGG
ncbi:MAG TPA: permease, partial [Aestuariivirga sp.]|nr:permease [Aestuariivirga sp.]